MITCPDCQAGLPGVDAKRCDACGWLRGSVDGVPEFLSSRDRSATLFAEYAANYETIARDDLEESIQPEHILAAAADRLMDAVGDVSGKRVCDLGVGRGILLRGLVSAGAAEVTAVDVVTGYLRTFDSDDRVRPMLANAENLPFAAEFDVLVAADVFEHVVRPGDFLVSVRDALLPNGMLAVRVPYRENLTQYARRNGCPYDYVHLRSFTTDSLVDVLERAGFRVDAVSWGGFYQSRSRRLLRSTRVAARLFDLFVDRVAGGAVGIATMPPRLARILMTPATITALARKVEA